MRTQDSLRRAVADAAQAMQSVRGREQSMQVAADAVRHLVDGCEVAAISVLTGEALRTVICSSAGGDDVRERVQEVDDLQYELAEGPCHQSMTLGDTVHSADIAGDDRWSRWAPVAVDRLGVRSVVSHPLTMAGRVLGVLKVYGTRRSAFTSDDIEQVATFAVHVSVALAAARDVEHLTDALDSRTLIGQATGLLMARYDLAPDAAFAVLARTSQTENVKVRDLAEQIVRTRELPQT